MIKTFKDFDQFSFENTAGKPHSGDFHLYFKDFTVLIDVKNFKSNIPKVDIDKIRRDLAENPQIMFAWMVSLETDISGQSLTPIKTEWINSGQAVLYINSVNTFSHPSALLRMAWYMSQTYYELLGNAKNLKKEDDGKVERENVKKILTHVSQMIKTMDGFKKMQSTFALLVKEMDDKIRTVLDIEGNTLLKKVAEIDIWWDSVVTVNNELVDESQWITSTKLWLTFKKTNTNVPQDIFIKYIITKEHVIYEKNGNKKTFLFKNILLK